MGRRLNPSNGRFQITAKPTWLRAWQRQAKRDGISSLGGWLRLILPSPKQLSRWRKASEAEGLPFFAWVETALNERSYERSREDQR